MGAYERFFSFRTRPFELVPNPDFIYMSKTHKKAMTYLDYGIGEKVGFMLLTGEVGSGKTTLIRDLIKKLKGRVNISKVFNTKVNSEQLISMINNDFGLDIQGRDKVVLLKDLYDFLIEQYAKGSHSILIIDEAQNLGVELLEEVRMLSNLETDKSKLLQIIIAGQPELRRTLARAELRQLRQRISLTCHILPLSRPETEEYIFHRLDVAGNRKAVSFSEGALALIHDFSRGIPRFINIVCDFLMLSAYADGTRVITVDLLREVIEAIEVDNRYWQDEAAGQPSAYGGMPSDEVRERLERVEERVLMTYELLSNYLGLNRAGPVDAGGGSAARARGIGAWRNPPEDR